MARTFVRRAHTYVSALYEVGRWLLPSHCDRYPKDPRLPCQRGLGPPARVRCFVVVNVIRAVICPETVRRISASLSLPRIFRSSTFSLQLANASNKNMFGGKTRASWQIKNFKNFARNLITCIFRLLLFFFCTSYNRVFASYVYANL